MTPVAPSSEPLPARMLNEYAYCPRLFHLMHVEGLWADEIMILDLGKAEIDIDRSLEMIGRTHHPPVRAMIV